MLCVVLFIVKQARVLAVWEIAIVFLNASAWCSVTLLHVLGCLAAYVYKDVGARGEEGEEQEEDLG